MSDTNPSVIVSTSLVTFFTGFLLGVYAIRGYLVSPDLKEERRRRREDPMESEEEDIDEGDTILDHAPNWENGDEADRRQGLKVSKPSKKEKKKKAGSPAKGSPAQLEEPAADNNEECKLVLVVRTDLGMTKGAIARPPFFFPLYNRLNPCALSATSVQQAC